MGCPAHGLCFHTAACPLCPGSQASKLRFLCLESHWPSLYRPIPPGSLAPWTWGGAPTEGAAVRALATSKWAPVASGHFSELLETVGPMEPRVPAEPCPGRLREEEVEGGLLTGALRGPRGPAETGAHGRGLWGGISGSGAPATLPRGRGVGRTGLPSL